MVATVAPIRPDASADAVTDAPEALVNVSEAARLVGCSRSTIVRRVRDGALTKRPGGTLQVVDLVRVFGELTGRDDAGEAPVRDAASDPVKTQSVPLSVVESMQDNMAELIEQLQRQGEAMREADAAHAADRAAMAARLDVVTSRLDRLLSHDAATSAPEPSRGIFRRLFG